MIRNTVPCLLAGCLCIGLAGASSTLWADQDRSAAKAVAATAQGCTNKSLKGRWGVDLQGEVLEILPGPVAIVGVLTSTGDGAFTGTGVTNFNGSIKPNVTYTGTYAVAADCTGTGTLVWPSMGISLDIYFVITGTGHAQEAWFANTSLLAIVHGRARKMTR